MIFENNATIRRRDLITRLAKLYFDNQLVEKIDQIPLELFPKRGDASRCCIYRSRAVVRYRLMALLGYNIEDEQDELKPLAEYARQALERTSIEAPVLTVIDDACSSCVKVNYFVTNACQGCVARPCMVNCPKDAIQMVDGHAKIDHAKCVNCGRCQNVCPYHAIIYMPVPCEEACPVGAISKDEHGLEQIDYSKCIFCGKCSRECPFGAIMEKSQVIDVLRTFSQPGGSIAMIAPAIVGQFPADFTKQVSALKALGFTKVVEVATGADITAEHEAAEFMEKMHENEPFMTSSCCPAYTEAVEKHIPEIKKYVSTTKTPLGFTAEILREKYPDAARVFIGPCIAKRKEALDNPLVDFVLTFEELGSMFVAKGIDVGTCDSEESELPAGNIGRAFPVVGGVADAIVKGVEGKCECKPIVIDGLNKKSITLLKAYAKGKCPGNFIEVMSCEGGCVAGPGVISNPKIATKKVQEFTSQ